MTDNLTWIKRDGGPMPVPGDAIVRIRCNDGYVDEGRASGYGAQFIGDTDWWNGGGLTKFSDMIAEYAIVTPSPGAVDNVNHPAHYTDGAIECIDAIKAQMTPEAFKGYLRGNVAKYVWRYEHKGGAESLEKAKWYLERLVTEVRNG